MRDDGQCLLNGFKRHFRGWFGGALRNGGGFKVAHRLPHVGVLRGDDTRGEHIENGLWWSARRLNLVEHRDADRLLSAGGECFGSGAGGELCGRRLCGLTAQPEVTGGLGARAGCGSAVAVADG